MNVGSTTIAIEDALMARPVLLADAGRVADLADDCVTPAASPIAERYGAARERADELTVKSLLSLLVEPDRRHADELDADSQRLAEAVTVHTAHLLPAESEAIGSVRLTRVGVTPRPGDRL